MDFYWWETNFGEGCVRGYPCLLLDPCTHPSRNCLNNIVKIFNNISNKMNVKEKMELFIWERLERPTLEGG